jgi:ATP-binding protein involved in chromosome partitioning
MVEDVAIEGSRVGVKIKLTIPGCPLKDRITTDVTAAVMQLDGVEDVQVVFGSMTDEERQQLSADLRAERGAANPEMEIPFAQADSPTKVIAIASGKGGVGKSTVTVNLAAALAKQGHNVGVLDADIWGYSVPRMFGVSGKPVAFDGMVMPLQAHGCKVISIGFFTDPDRSVIWRGPMLHRAIQQFLSDVHWGELDVLLCDLPPGTGDIAISLAQMLPNADMVVVTTPQQAAQKVALRAGKATEQTGMKVAGVVENMAGFTDPDCGSAARDLRLRRRRGARRGARDRPARSHPDRPAPARGRRRRVPLVVSHPDVPASQAITAVAETWRPVALRPRPEPAAQRVLSRPRAPAAAPPATPRRGRRPRPRPRRCRGAPRPRSGWPDTGSERGHDPGGPTRPRPARARPPWRPRRPRARRPRRARRRRDQPVARAALVGSGPPERGLDPLRQRPTPAHPPCRPGCAARAGRWPARTAVPRRPARSWNPGRSRPPPWRRPAGDVARSGALPPRRRAAPTAPRTPR